MPELCWRRPQGEQAKACDEWKTYNVVNPSAEEITIGQALIRMQAERRPVVTVKPLRHWSFQRIGKKETRIDEGPPPFARCMRDAGDVDFTTYRSEAVLGGPAFRFLCERGGTTEA